MSDRQKAGRRGSKGGAGGLHLSPGPLVALAVVILAAAAFILLQSRPGTAAWEITAA